jgi:hypothetical protein
MKKCTKHPKYDGKKLPKYKTPCVDCLNYYNSLKSPRVLPMPTKVYKDKSKYTRKDKHKGKNEE